jgi:serine-type D-Ala-D-Ala carboxypeptidase (penicillin-binding protein 5/6)
VLDVPHDIYVTVPRGQVANLKTNLHVLMQPLIAPIARNEPLGDLTVTDPSGQVIAHTPLVALKAVPEGGLWTRMSDDVALWFQ